MLTKTKNIIDRYTNVLVVTGLLLVIVVTLSGNLSFGFGKGKKTAKAAAPLVTTESGSSPNDSVTTLILNGSYNSPDSPETNGRITVELVQSARKINLNITSSGKALSRRMLHALEGPIINPRKLDAVGAGLYLNQIIVEAVGGKFSVVSDSKTGTLVKAQIPQNYSDVNNFKPNTELDNPELDMFKGKVKPA